MKKPIALALALVMILSLAACGGGTQPVVTPEPAPTATPTLTATPESTPPSPEEIMENLNFNEIYNSELGALISLGMEKSEVDALLGEPEIERSKYEYVGDLSVEYDKEDKVSLLSFNGNDWKVKYNIGIRSTFEKLTALWGEGSLLTSPNGSLFYRYALTKNNEFLPYVDDAEYIVYFGILESASMVTYVSIGVA